MVRTKAGWSRIPLINDRRMGADATGPKKPLSDTVRQLGALSTVGFSFVLAVVLGAGLGLLIDRWLGHEPVGLLRLLRVRPGRGRAQRLPHGRQLSEIVERDPTLRGVERNAIVIGVLMTVAALLPAAVARPRARRDRRRRAGRLQLLVAEEWRVGDGRRCLSTARERMRVAPRVNMRRELAKLVLRYALLALLAYVMIARLRLHPWGCWQVRPRLWRAYHWRHCSWWSRSDAASSSLDA